MKSLLLFSYFLALGIAAQSDMQQIEIRKKTLSLPGNKVQLLIHTQNTGPVFFNMHDDENTSTEAILQVIADSGGTYIELCHNGKRNIQFKRGRKRYIFDPNRIFTDEGIQATLEKNGKYDKRALKTVRNFAEKLLEIVLKESPDYIFTLHNNTPDNLSVYSYAPVGEYEADAEITHANPHIDHDDFIYVTKRLFYDYFVICNQNTILQNQHPSNDGSLSVWAAQKNIPYINIEAEHGHVEAQKSMIILSYQMLQHPAFGGWLKPQNP